MSHTTEIGSVVITDIPALKKAVRQLNQKGVECELVQNATPRMYYPRQQKELENSPYVLKLKNADYDVAFRKNDKGEYTPVTDLWANSVAGQIGASCPMPSSPEGKAQHAIGQLMQQYSENAVRNAASRQGYQVERVFTDKQGRTQVIINAG